MTVQELYDGVIKEKLHDIEIYRGEGRNRILVKRHVFGAKNPDLQFAPIDWSIRAKHFDVITDSDIEEFSYGRRTLMIYI